VRASCTALDVVVFAAGHWGAGMNDRVVWMAAAAQAVRGQHSDRAKSEGPFQKFRPCPGNPSLNAKAGWCRGVFRASTAPPISLG
jgi:hypothetical protein